MRNYTKIKEPQDIKPKEKQRDINFDKKKTKESNKQREKKEKTDLENDGRTSGTWQ